MIDGIVRDFGATISGFLGVSTSMGEMIGVGIIIFGWVLLMAVVMRVMWRYRRALLRGRELNMSFPHIYHFSHKTMGTVFI